jgi:hypothetical protein
MQHERIERKPWVDILFEIAAGVAERAYSSSDGFDVQPNCLTAEVRRTIGVDDCRVGAACHQQQIPPPLDPHVEDDEHLGSRSRLTVLWWQPRGCFPCRIALCSFASSEGIGQSLRFGEARLHAGFNHMRRKVERGLASSFEVGVAKRRDRAADPATEDPAEIGGVVDRGAEPLD